MTWGPAHVHTYTVLGEGVYLAYSSIKYLLKAPMCQALFLALGKNKTAKIPVVMEIDIKQDKYIKLKVY